MHRRDKLRVQKGALAALGISAAAWGITQSEAATQAFQFAAANNVSGEYVSADNSPKAWIMEVGNNWMQYVPNDRKVSDLTIPGTHNSAADQGGFVVKNQNWTIQQQLIAGIRYFDIRVRRAEAGAEDAFTIHHGSSYLDLNFSDVLRDMDEFLETHPSEGIIMRLKGECTGDIGSCKDDDRADSHADIFADYARKYDDRFLTPANSRFTMGDLRGKILIARDSKFTDSISEGLPYSKTHFKIQDNYYIDGAKDAKIKKINSIRKAMEEAGPSERITINHASATGLSGYDGKWFEILGKVVNPLSDNLGWKAKHAWSHRPAKLAETFNAAAYSKIVDFPGRASTGILVMDFPGEELIYALIVKNFTSPTTCGINNPSANSQASGVTFHLPRAVPGQKIRYEDGNISKFTWKCNRVAWSNLTYTCNQNGKWEHSGGWKVDGMCSASKNTEQFRMTTWTK